MLLFGPYGWRQSAPLVNCHHCAPVAQVDRMARRREHQRAGVDHVRQRAWIVLRVRRDFGEGDVAGGADERLELPVGHRRAVDPEAIDRDAMDRRLFRVVPVRPHAERAAGDHDHARRTLFCMRGGRCRKHRHNATLPGQRVSGMVPPLYGAINHVEVMGRHASAARTDIVPFPSGALKSGSSLVIRVV